MGGDATYVQTGMLSECLGAGLGRLFVRLPARSKPLVNRLVDWLAGWLALGDQLAISRLSEIDSKQNFGTNKIRDFFHFVYYKIPCDIDVCLKIVFILELNHF